MLRRSFLILLLLALPATFIVGRELGKRSPGFHVHSTVRNAAILSQAEQAEPGGAVLIGDSITEFLHMPTLCGLPVLNAGTGGARLADVAKIVPELVARAKPAHVVLSVGVNDAQLAERRDVAAWKASYAHLISRLSVPRVTILGVRSPDPSKKLAKIFDAAFIDEENDALADLAKATHVAFVPSAPVDTVDGVHLSAAGYDAFRRGITDVLCR